MSVNFAKRPRTLTLTASTRKAVEASYLASWVQKIEQTGNLNYPSEARLKKLDGRLRMSVRINAAGEMLDMQITRSSGNSILDEAARQILRMAQPFPPSPTNSGNAPIKSLSFEPGTSKAIDLGPKAE